MAKKKQSTFTRAHARLIMEAHDIGQTFDDPEEAELLEANNPELFEAYKALKGFVDNGTD